MAPPVTIEEYAARQTEIRTRIKEIDADAAGTRLNDEQRAEWNDLNEELDGNEVVLAELRARQERVLAVSTSNDAKHLDLPTATHTAGGRRKRVPDDVYAVEQYRNMSTTDSECAAAMVDGAKMVLDRTYIPHPDADKSEQMTHLEGLLDRLGTKVDPETGWSFARRVLETSSPAYVSGFGKYLAGARLNTDEQRALGIGSQGGGYPVPIVLDPTVVLTSSGQVNPLRQIARVEQIVGNTWDGVATSGATAAYAAEFTEASDNSPTLTQPTATVVKAQAFIPFSIENAEDWGGLQSEMAVVLQDAKDALEADKFLNGTGSGQPQGLHNGATAVYASAATATFAVADLYGAEQALPVRWVPRASIIANKAALNKIRQFDTAGGASLWVQLGDGTPSRLLDYPTYQYSSMNASVTTTAATILTIGDFTQFRIFDRIGLNIELIPHLFATANNRPSGSRGLYAHWRNTSVVVTANAFKSIKLL